MKKNTSCKLSAGDLHKKLKIYSLIARGPGSKFEVSTTDSKVILEIMGDVDISNEGFLS